MEYMILANVENNSRTTVAAENLRIRHHPPKVGVSGGNPTDHGLNCRTGKTELSRARREDRMPGSGRVFEIRAQWDGEAGVWWCSNDELPLTTEAPTFEQLVSRVLEIAPEIAAENRSTFRKLSP